MAKISRMTKKRLGEMLAEAGLVDQAQLEHGLEEQRRTGQLLGEVLIRLGYVSEEDVARTLVQQFGIPFLRASQYYISKDMLDLFPEQMLRQYGFVPVDRIGNVLVVVAAGVLNQDIINELERATSGKVQVYIGTQSDVTAAIERHFHKEEVAAELSSLGSLLLGDESAVAGAADAGLNLDVDGSPELDLGLGKPQSGVRKT